MYKYYRGANTAEYANGHYRGAQPSHSGPQLKVSKQKHSKSSLVTM